MARLTRLVLMVGCVFGSSTVAPTQTQAGVIPWVYDSIFGPVGSIRARRTYAPMYASSASYGYGASYAPTMASYGYGTGCSSCNTGCNSCNQSTSYYPPSGGYDAFYGSYQAYPTGYGNQCCNNCSSGGGCSNGNCATGNCATGNCGSGNCTNCSANSPPTSGYGSNSSGYGSGTSGYGSGPTPTPAPVPDPNLNSRDLNYRLNELEHRLNEDEKFLRKKHTNEYQPDPYARPNSTYESTVPARRKTHTIDSNNPADPNNYEKPLRPRNDPAPIGDPLEEERRKPELSAPNAINEKTIDPANDDSANFKEAEPQTFRFQDRATSQAVAPRARMTIVTKQSKTAIAKSLKQPVKTSSEGSHSPELARN